MRSSVILLSAAVALVAGQAQKYAQCGGKLYNGPKTCTDGWQCLCQNPWYSQCLPAGWAGVGWNQAGCGAAGGSSPSGSKSSSASTPVPVINQVIGTPRPGLPSSSASLFGGNIQRPYQFYGEPTGFPSSLSTVIRPSASPVAAAGLSTGNGGLSGSATTTHYFDGQKGACGCGGSDGAMSPWQANRADGFYTAAGSSGLFGQSQWCGTGCGNCFQLTSTGKAPPGQGTGGPMESITVMITNLCPADGNEQWCSTPNNYGKSFHFDLMNAPPGWDNPIVDFKQIDCPSAMATDYKTCQCQGGVAARGS